MQNPERVRPGYKLVVSSGAFAPKPIREEYFEICDLLLNVVGSDNMAVIGKDGEIPALLPHFRIWPRDASAEINGRMLLFDDAWHYQGHFLPGSYLGEGGRILVRKNAIIAAEAVVRDSSLEIMELIQEGYKIATLPEVTCQGNYFVATHVDGQANLIEAQDGDLVLLIAQSYENQDQGETAAATELAAERVGARKIVVDDSKLPPLSLNFVQFDDLSIAMTAGAPKLEELLRGLVGKSVYTTRNPLIQIPTNTTGSIRCLTNIFPEEFLQKS